MGAAAEQVPEVGGQRADVGARRALDLDAVDERVGRRLDVEAVDRHRPGRPLDLDALAGQLVQAAAADLERRHHRRHLHDRRRSRWSATARADVVEVDVGHVVAGDDLAGGVEGRRLHAEHDLARCRSCGRSVRKRSSRVTDADADEQHAGGVGVERAGVADAALAEAPAAAAATTSWLVTPAGLSTTSRPWTAGGLRRASVALRRRPASASPSCGASRRICSMRSARADDLVGAELQHRRLAGVDLAADRRLQPDPAVPPKRLEDLGVAGLAGQRVEVDDGPVQVGVDVDRGDADQLQALVVDALELLGRRPRAAARSRRAVRGRLAARRRRRGDRWPLLTPTTSVRSTATSISGCDQTKRSTSSMTSVAWSGAGGDHARSPAGPAATGPGGRPRRPSTPNRRRAPSSDRLDHLPLVLQRLRVGRSRSTSCTRTNIAATCSTGCGRTE